MMIALLALYLVGLVVTWRICARVRCSFLRRLPAMLAGSIFGLAVAAELVFRPPPAKTPLLLSVSCFLCGPLFLWIVGRTFWVAD